MAVKGYLVIDSEDDSYRLRKEPDARLESLSGGERRIAKQLFADESILLDNENHALLGKTVKRLKESLRLEYEKAYFRRNTSFFGRRRRPEHPARFPDRIRRRRYFPVSPRVHHDAR